MKTASIRATRPGYCHLAICVVLALGLLIGPAVAQADEMPLWSDPITTTAWAAEGVAGREALFSNELHRGGFDTVRVVNSDGTSEYQGRIEGATIAPALAADGSGYVLLGGGAEEVVEAITTTGKRRWRYTAPSGDIVRALLAGTDGAAYIALSTPANVQILRLSPVDGTVTFATPLPKGINSPNQPIQMFAEPTGVAVATETQVLFLSQQGQITADASVAPAESAAWFASNNAGDVFVGYVPDHGANTAKGITISEIGPGGKIDWHKRTPHNPGTAGPTGLAAFPDGGVAYEVSGQSVGALNANGSARWSMDSPEGAYMDMAADSSDHVDLVSLVNNSSCSDVNDSCSGFVVDQLVGSDGAVESSVPVISSSGPSQFWFCGGFAIGPGKFYVLDRLSPDDGESCGNGTTQPQLQAYSLPEAAGPYPVPPPTTESANQSSSPSYVALGDSYSSGEGNPPYEEGSNIEGELPNKCHRSATAYGPLLSKALNLEPAAFKACSGAETNDIFEQNPANPTEPSQLSWLRPDTTTITLTIGGDDAGFPWVLEHCVAAPPFRLGDLKCSTNDQLNQETQARLSALAGGPYATTSSPLYQPIHSILSVIQAIHAHAHSAHIYFGFYPLLFAPEKTYYSDLIPGLGKTLACEVGPNLWVSYKVAVWLNKLGNQLNKDISDAITEARRKGIAVTPVTVSGFIGHEFCGEGERWFHPAGVAINHLLELEPVIGGATGSFHPTEIGQRLGYEVAFAKVIG